MKQILNAFVDLFWKIQVTAQQKLSSEAQCKFQKYLQKQRYGVTSDIAQDLRMLIRDALCDFLPFVQFKKREKHPWRSVTFNKVAG